MGETILLRISRIRRAVRREFESHAAELDITSAQFRVLYRLWQGDGLLTSVLTSEASSDGGTITGLLDRMEAKGLIRRERSTEDRRTVRVFLTPAGRALQCPLMKILNALDDRAVSGFTPDERARFVRDLDRVGGNLGA